MTGLPGDCSIQIWKHFGQSPTQVLKSQSVQNLLRFVQKRRRATYVKGCVKPLAPSTSPYRRPHTPTPSDLHRPSTPRPSRRRRHDYQDVVPLARHLEDQSAKERRQQCPRRAGTARGRADACLLYRVAPPPACPARAQHPVAPAKAAPRHRKDNRNALDTSAGALHLLGRSNPAILRAARSSVLARTATRRPPASALQPPLVHVLAANVHTQLMKKHSAGIRASLRAGVSSV